MADKNIRQCASVDFTTGRGFGPMGQGLPANFLTFAPHVVCSTIAGLYNQPNDGDDNPNAADGEQRPPRRLSNSMSRAMVQLALYAGGALFKLDKQQYRQLERRVRRYASVMEAPHYEGTNNLPFARYVLRHAEARAKEDGTI